MLCGNANVRLNSVEEESTHPVVDEWQMNSNASRLWVNDGYAIGDNLKAIYKIGFEIHIDDGKSSSSKGGSTDDSNAATGYEHKF